MTEGYNAYEQCPQRTAICIHYSDTPHRLTAKGWIVLRCCVLFVDSSTEQWKLLMITRPDFDCMCTCICDVTPICSTLPVFDASSACSLFPRRSEQAMRVTTKNKGTNTTTSTRFRRCLRAAVDKTKNSIAGHRVHYSSHSTVAVTDRFCVSIQTTRQQHGTNHAFQSFQHGQRPSSGTRASSNKGCGR